MILKIMSNFDLAMFFSKIISINGIIVQILLIVVSFAVFKEKYKKVKVVINIFLIILLVLNGIFIFNGRLTERSIDDFKGKVYIGQVENGEANGWGRLYDENRNMEYIGHFHNNEYEGEGILYHYDVNEKENVLGYEGGFHEGKFCGDGKYYIFVHNELLIQYEGEFRGGQYCGKGILYFYDYDENNKKIGTYNGGFAYDKRFGFGIDEFYYADTKSTVKYEGTFKDDKFDGYGTMYHDNKIYYTGDWSDNYKEGNGTLYFTNASGQEMIYKGGFLKDKLNGDGIIYDKNNNIIEKGKYKNGELVKKYSSN